MSSQHRQPAGRPAGGQFAPIPRSSSGLTLTVDQPAPVSVETPEALLAAVRAALTDYENGEGTAPYYLEAVTEHLGGIDASRFEPDFFHPMARALHDGDDGEALRQAERAMRVAERERRWPAHPTFTEPVFVTEVEDPMYGDRVVGTKYDPSRPLAEAGRLLRKDVKEAVAAGYLPDDLDYRVRTDTRGTNAITVHAFGMADEDYYVPGHVFGQPEAVPSAQAKMVEERLQNLAEVYTSQQSNSQVDYWNHSAFVSARVHSASQTRQMKAWAETDKQATKHRKARRDRDPQAAGEAAGAYAAARQEHRQAVEDHEALMRRIRFVAAQL